MRRTLPCAIPHEMTEEVVPLSDREREVLELVVTGATNQQIARELVISPNTVKVHLRNIFEKLGVQSRTEATTEAIRRGLVFVGPDVLPVENGVRSQAGSGLAPAELPQPKPVVDWLPEPVGPRPIAPWQRVYALVALLLVILAAFAPGWWQSRTQAAPASFFSDAGRSVSASPQRVETPRWSAGAAMPEGRSRLALAARPGLVYAIAGETAGGLTDALAVYTPRENAWRSGPPKPTAVANVAAAVIGDRIYVPGGTTAGGVTDVLEVYDAAADAWVTGASLPRPLAAYGLASWDGKLYLSGGWDGAAYRAETYIYDPLAGAWSAGPSLPSPRAFHGSAALGGVVYVAGGYDGRRELDELLALQVENEGVAGEWSRRGRMEQGRAGFGLTALGTRLYAVGGGWARPAELNEQYDTQVDAWSRFGTPIPAGWRNLGLVALEQKLYAVGGWSSGYLAVNEQYQALLRQLLPLGGRSP